MCPDDTSTFPTVHLGGPGDGKNRRSVGKAALYETDTLITLPVPKK